MSDVVEVHRLLTTGWSMNEALASVHSDLQAVMRDHDRLLKQYYAARNLGDGELSAERMLELGALKRQARALTLKQDRLLDALTAHQLDWCHLPEDCALCTGEVTR